MAENYVKFLKKHWLMIITRNIAIYQNALVTAAYQKSYKKYNVPPNEAVYITKNGRMTYSFINIENNSQYNKDLEKFYKHPQLLKKLEATFYRYGKSLMKKSKQLSKKITPDNYISYVRAAKIHFNGLMITSVFGTHLSRILNEKLKILYPDLNQQEIDILISEMTYPGKRTPLTESQKALLEIGIILQKGKKNTEDIPNNSKLKRKFDAYMEKFYFIPVNFLDDPWTEGDIFMQLKKMMRGNCQKELDIILKNDQARKIKSRKLTAKVKDIEIRNLVKAIQVGTYLNEYRKYVACYANLAFRPILYSIAKRYNLSSWKECWKLIPSEIEKLYFKGDKKVLKVISERETAGICFSKNKDGFRLMTKKEVALFLKYIEEKPKNSASGNNEIKGIIANKGIIRGIARVIEGKHEFHKFKDGDIIVTAMTSVDFVPIMKRASAYVTNEGAITSHAAIVSRELNKPCIVGTKNATKILKDGDLIEVNANEGVVKILKRK